MMQTYTVAEGDTLSGIALRSRLSLAELLAANPQVIHPDLIQIGARINLPAAPEGGLAAAEELPLWFRLALAELGVKEVPGPGSSPRIVEYHQATDLRATDDETPWCSAFVNWCFRQAGIVGTRSAAARSWLRWGAAVALALADGPPREGDVVVLSRGVSPWQGHVGFYAGPGDSREVDGDGNPVHWLRLLGGNQGNAVTIAQHPVSRVLGYRRPLL